MCQENPLRNNKRMRWLWLAVFIIGLVILLQSHVIQRTVSDVVYDNYDHFLPCERLPLFAEVENILVVHEDMVDQVKGISSQIDIQIDPHTCGGVEHADLVIFYATHAQREQIEEMLGGKTFFGIPARWINW